MQAHPRGKDLVQAPTKAHRMDDVQAVCVQRRVQEMLQPENNHAHLSAHSRATTATIDAAYMKPQPSAPSAAASVSTAVDLLASRGSVAAEMTACSSSSDMSEEQEVLSDCGTSPQEDDKAADRQRDALDSKGARLAVLQYKKGRLSRHGLLSKVASSRTGAATAADLDMGAQNK